MDRAWSGTLTIAQLVISLGPISRPNLSRTTANLAHCLTGSQPRSAPGPLLSLSRKYGAGIDSVCSK